MPRTEKKAMTPDEMVAYREHLRNVETTSAKMRAAEGKINVYNELVATKGDKYQQMADDAQTEYEELTSELDDLNEKTGTWGQDLEGTKADLSDLYGNYAANARVARAGGTRIKGSNSVGDSGGEPAEDPEEAGDEPVGGQVAVLDVGNRLVSLKGKEIAIDSDDELEEDEEAAGVSGDEQAGPSKARSSRRQNREKTVGRGTPRRRRRGQQEEEPTEE